MREITIVVTRSVGEPVSSKVEGEPRNENEMEVCRLEGRVDEWGWLEDAEAPFFERLRIRNMVKFDFLGILHEGVVELNVREESVQEREVRFVGKGRIEANPSSLWIVALDIVR